MAAATTAEVMVATSELLSLVATQAAIALIIEITSLTEAIAPPESIPLTVVATKIMPTKTLRQLIVHTKETVIAHTENIVLTK